MLITNGLCFCQAKSMLKRDLDIKDITAERPLKKQRAALPGEMGIGSVQDEIAGLKKAVEQVAADTQDIKNTLHELLCEIRGKR